jgi:hypothetical protein
MTFRLPNLTQRISVVGRTGSGKTAFAAWLLSVSPFHKQPYIIIDYKGDVLLNSVDRVREIGLQDKIPTKPGVYIVHPRPKTDDDLLNKFLYRVWETENTGLFFDEAYMVPWRMGAFEGILTQGRSLHIPAIVLTQRPAWVSQFIFSEADFFAIFHLNKPQDRARITEITGGNIDQLLPDYYSRYFDVAKNQMIILQPCPPPETIMQTLHDRLKPEKARFR